MVFYPPVRRRRARIGPEVQVLVAAQASLLPGLDMEAWGQTSRHSLKTDMGSGHAGRTVLAAGGQTQRAAEEQRGVLGSAGEDPSGPGQLSKRCVLQVARLR